jgi:hypothetical protein
VQKWHLGYVNSEPPVVVIPQALKDKFLKAIHDNPLSGYGGRDKTLAKAKENGWWWGMNSEIIKYVKNCLNANYSNHLPISIRK